MELNNYIKNLQDLKPSEELLLKKGFTTIPYDIIKNYDLDPRKSDRFREINGLIFELFDNYNPKYFRFADFTFYDKIESKNNLFVFAGSSYSELTFRSINEEVIEYDREEWSTLNYCAKDADSFLEALLVIFEMYSLRFQNLIDRKDNVVNNTFLERCISIAGGNKYNRFYKDIIL